MCGLIGCSQSQLSKLENGHAPRAWTWERYMKPLRYETREAFQRAVVKAKRQRMLKGKVRDNFPLGRFAQSAGQTLPLPQTSAAEKVVGA